ncbi:MAG: DUF1311 domain-containing protein [Alphaproteobacteria bacterium]|nr:DUF1311 domain-containing protein [Alphaproteobacteria bacterium]
MGFRVRIVLAVLTGLMLPAAGMAAERSGFSKRFDDCMAAANGVSSEENQCVAAETDASDKKLNDVYHKWLLKNPGEDGDAMRSAQRLWIKFRDANCKAISGPLGGRMAEGAFAYCIMRMTAERATELEERLP